MRRAVVASFLVMALLFSALPGWAAGSASSDTSSPMPAGVELDDAALDSVTGSIFWLGRILAGAAAGAAIGAIGSYIESGEVSWRSVAAGAIGGAITGALGGGFRIWDW